MQHEAILFFDGECNLCNHAVQFVIRHDCSGRIKFAPLQSPAGLEAQAAVKAAIGAVPDSLIFYKSGKYLTESDAALGVSALLDGGWQWLKRLSIFPLGIRNWVYRGVAKRRLRWFGRRDSCMIPTPELADRFILS